MRSPSVDHREDVERMCSLIHTAASTYIAHTTTKAFAKQITEAILSFLKGISVISMCLISVKVIQSIFIYLHLRIILHSMKCNKVAIIHGKRF